MKDMGQSTPGFPNEHNANRKEQGSRDRKDGQVGQERPGYPHTADGATKEAGSDTPYLQEARGFVHNEKARNVPTKHVNDLVRKGS